MSNALRQRLFDLYAAFARGGFGFVLHAIDDDIDFTSYAPVEFFPYLGHHRGKTEFMATLRATHDEFEFLSYQPIFMVAEKDDAATIIMARLRQRKTDRTIHLFIAISSASATGALSNSASSWIPLTPSNRSSAASSTCRTSNKTKDWTLAKGSCRRFTPRSAP